MKVREGDLIIKANQKSMSGPKIIEEMKSGEDIDLTFWRSYSQSTRYRPALQF